MCAFGNPVSGGGLKDAAAAYGNPVLGRAVFSLHATKSLPAGEGGLVLGEKDFLDRVRRLANFGLRDGLVIEVGTNAKMSEFHAACCLASLDEFPETARKRRELEARYVQNLSGLVGLQRRPLDGVYMSFQVLVSDPVRVAVRLAEDGIETKRWYTPSCDKQPGFGKYSVMGSLEVTKDLNARVLSLPYHVKMTLDDVDFVCERLLQACRAKNSKIAA